MALQVPFVRWDYERHPRHLNQHGSFYYLITAGGLRENVALSLGLAIVFVVITAGVAIVKVITGSIGMPRLLPELVDQAFFWKLFATVPVVVAAYICHHNRFAGMALQGCFVCWKFQSHEADLHPDEGFYYMCTLGGAREIVAETVHGVESCVSRLGMVRED